MAIWHNLAKRLPRFSLGSLFVVMTCCAIGLMMATGSSVGMKAGWGGFVTDSRIYFDVLLAVASVLLTVELWSQQTQIRRCIAKENVTGAGITNMEVLSRLFFAVALLLMLVLSLLKQHGVIARPTHPEPFLFMSVGLFPQVVWLVSLNMALLVATGTTSRLQHKLSRSLIERLIVWASAIFLMWHLVSEEYFLSFLVHLATSGIEAGRASNAQRQSMFPTHASEHYFTFYSSVAGLLAILAAVHGLIVISTSSIRSKRWWRGFIAYSAGIGIGAFYVGWYYARELFRVSPDIAPQIAQAAVRQDWIGGGLIAILVSVYGAIRLTKSNLSVDNSTSLAIKTTRRLLFANLAMFCASGIFVYDVIHSAITPMATFAFGDVTVDFEMIRYVFLDPEKMLLLAMLFATLEVAWRWFRRGAPEIVIQPIETRRVFWTWLGLVALVIVGVPVIAAFGFCWWLGPWYLW